MASQESHARTYTYIIEISLCILVMIAIKPFIQLKRSSIASYVGPVVISLHIRDPNRFFFINMMYIFLPDLGSLYMYMYFSTGTVRLQDPLLFFK